MCITVEEQLWSLAVSGRASSAFVKVSAISSDSSSVSAFSKTVTSRASNSGKLRDNADDSLSREWGSSLGLLLSVPVEFRRSAFVGLAAIVEEEAEDEEEVPVVASKKFNWRGTTPEDEASLFMTRRLLLLLAAGTGVEVGLRLKALLSAENQLVCLGMGGLVVMDKGMGLSSTGPSVATGSAAGGEEGELFFEAELDLLSSGHVVMYCKKSKQK